MTYGLSVSAASAPRGGGSGADSGAVWAFALALLGIPLTAVVSIAAVVLAHRSLRRSDEAGQRGAGLASAALVIGYGTIAVTVVVLAFAVAFLASSTAA